MRMWQEAANDDVGVCGLPGINAWRTEFTAAFADAEIVYVVLDNDQGYNVRAKVDQTWRQIRHDLGRKARRLPAWPNGIKDVCEFFQTFSLDDLRELAASPATSGFHYQALDLTDAHIPKPVDWLVEGLIGQGDVTLLFGEPSVGKSWLSMSLALGIVKGQSSWLGLPLTKQGRVLYVDEENPEDVVRLRLSKLGIGNVDSPSIRYLHEQGIRLDVNPDSILEEALAFEPTLIVIDSLTRVHTQDENNAQSVARLFNDAIKPLSRETGATVMVLHHATKSRDGSSYNRARGSGDITGSVDTGLEAFSVDPGRFKLIHSKSRRRLPHSPISVELVDTEEGGVALMTTPLPF